MTRRAGVLLLAVMVFAAVPALAQQAAAPVTATRQAFQSLELGMTREQVSKAVSSPGPMDLKRERWRSCGSISSTTGPTGSSTTPSGSPGGGRRRAAAATG